MLSSREVEGKCKRLSPITLQTIKKLLIQQIDIRSKAPDFQYTGGEALVLWFADYITGVGLLGQEQLLFLISELQESIKTYGSRLYDVLSVDPNAASINVPMFKIGFMDRRIACADGVDFFLNLTTGKTSPVTDVWPVETIAYNLSVIFYQYCYRGKKFDSAESKLTG